MRAIFASFRLAVGVRATALGAAVVIGLAVTDRAEAQIIAAPPSVSIFPTQTTSTVTLTIANIQTPGPITYPIAFTGLPAGVTTNPTPVNFTIPAGTPPNTTTTTLQFVSTSATPPGTYTVNMQSPSVTCGTVPPYAPCAGTMTLQIQQPSFTASVAPNPAVIAWGGSQAVTVTITPDPGLIQPLNVWFAGFPAGISTGGTLVSNPPYPPVGFTFSVAGGTTPGIYNGTLYVQQGTMTPQAYPMAVTVLAPDILASFTQPAMSVCQSGATVTNGLVLQPAGGYAGTPLLSFTSVPAGLTVAPLNPVASPMPPGQTVPFTVQATGASPGAYPVTLRVQDLTAGIDKNVGLTVNVNVGDFTRAVTPASLSVPSGGQASGYQASITPGTCFAASTVTVSPSGAPAGVTFVPAAVTLTAPTFTPTGFTVQVASSVAAGTYPLIFTFTPSVGPARTIGATLTVTVGPDFSLTVNPPTLPIVAGQSGSVTVSATAVNGFTDTVSVVTSAPPGVTVNPAAFALAPGAPQLLTVLVDPMVPAGVAQVSFSGTAPSVTTPRTASLALQIAAGPDFSLSVSPPSVSTPAGGSGTVTVTAQGLNGFSGAINVISPAAADVTFTPAAFALLAGGSQTVTFQVAPSATVGSRTHVFTGTAGGVTGARFASFLHEVTAGPDFALAVTPPALTLVPGSSTAITVSASSLNGFSDVVNVVAPSLGGVTLTPASFTLPAGGSQTVAVQVAANAMPGSVTGMFTGAAASVVGSRSAPFSVQIVPPPDFSLTATPAALTIDAGSMASLNVTVTPLHGFSAVASVTVLAPAGMTVEPAAFALPAGGTRALSVRIPASANAGTLLLRLDGTASGVAGARSVTVPVTVIPLPPVIETITPPALAAGTADSVLRLGGEYFRPGAVASSPSPDLSVTRTTVLSPTLADVAVTVRAGAPPGSYRIDLVNPDGTRTSQGIVLVVFPTSSLAAPLGVTVAAIVHPLPYTLFSPAAPVFPRGLLATTGLGAVVGSWQLDGFPFDRFTVQASGGMPVEIKATVPIPVGITGEHRLELVIEQPRSLVSAPVSVIQAPETRSQFAILAPPEGTVFGATPPLIRWSLLPGTSGFLVEIAREQGGPLLQRRMSLTEWRPSESDVAEIGPGQHRLRVRPVFPGEVVGEPTAWLGFGILPEHVELSFEPLSVDPATGRTQVRWRGGVPGLVYRLELFGPEGNQPFASALTPRQEYPLPAGAPAGPLRARVRALDHEGRPRGGSGMITLSVRPAPQARLHTFRLAQLPAQLTARTPDDGEVLTTRRPRVEARWVGALKPEEITMLLDATDVTPLAQLGAESVVFEPLEDLADGDHTVSLSLAGVITSWTFSVGAAGGVVSEVEEGAEPAVPASPGLMPEPHRGGEALLMVTVNGQDETGGTSGWDTARAQLSTQFDAAGGAFEAKGTGDLSGRHTMQDPRSTESESRSWDLLLAGGGPHFRAEARGGYSPPDFLDQSEFLTAGLSRGGVEGKAVTPFGSLAYYRTTREIPAGIGQSAQSLAQQIEAAGFELPGDPNKLLLRAFALRSEGERMPDVETASAEAAGIFGRWSLSPALQLLFEGARGRLDPGPGDEVKGNAFRFGATGTVKGFTYGLTLRKTDAEFINPANPGLTPGGIPDRQGGDLSLSRMFGRISLSLQARRLESGGGQEAGPKIVEDGGGLNLTMPLGQFVTLAAGANLTTSSGDADPERYMPATDRSSAGLSLTLTEMAGAASFSQALTWQDTSDDVMPGSDQDVMSLNLSANGTLRPWLMLTGMFGATRTDAAQPMGRTDQLMVSLQPTVTLATLNLTLTPRGSYTRVEGKTAGTVNESEQYQLVVQWAPPWLGSFLAFEIAGDLTRSRSNVQPGHTPFHRRVVATLTMRRNATLPPPAPVTAVLQPVPGASPYQTAGRL